MKLLVDIGNTRFKWGVLKKDGAIRLGQPIDIAENLPDKLNRMGLNQYMLERILVSNVGSPEFKYELVQWSRKMGHGEIDFIRTQAEAWGVINAYEQPEKLGVDRWLCLIAMRNRYPLPACIVDCGTAITLDALDCQGQHLGGLIVPGLRLMRDSLVQGTRGINERYGKIHRSLLANNTESAIQRGITQAACGVIERVFRQLRADMGNALKIYITGGDAPLVASELEFESVLLPALVLEGLAVIARATQ